MKLLSRNARRKPARSQTGAVTPILNLPEASALVAYTRATAGDGCVQMIQASLDDPAGDVLHAQADVMHQPVLVVLRALRDRTDRLHVLAQGNVAARDLSTRITQHLGLY